jgi:hypothetical protein
MGGIPENLRVMNRWTQRNWSYCGHFFRFSISGTEEETKVSIEFRIDLVRISAEPPLMALADVVLLFSEGEITIRRCAVFEKSGQPPWATLLRIPVDKAGKRIYAPFLDLPGDLKKRILRDLLTEFGKQRDAESSTVRQG